MNKYIECNLIKAERAYRKNDRSNIMTYDEIVNNNEDINDYEDGYMIKYPNDSIVWYSQKEFESSHLKLFNNSDLKSDISISQEMVEKFIDTIETKTIGNKTTLVIATLINGYEITETNSCVDAANYDEKIGAEICINKIKNKIWELLGFLLQTAKNGIK